MNLLEGRTIEIYLPNGNPKSVRIARDTVRPLNLLSFNITELDNVSNRLQDVNGCYLLHGKSVDDTDQIYIGETDSLYRRIKDHRDKKDFWDTAYIVVNDSGTFDKAHLHYLESLMIKQATDVGRFEVLNGNSGQRSTITEQKEAECLNYFDTIKLLLSTLGLDVFKPIPNLDGLTSNDDVDIVYEYKGSKKQWSGKLKILDDQFFVLKGSLARKELVNHVRINPKSPVLQLRNKFLSDGVLVEKDEYYEFTKDVPFNSPSRAAAALSGRHDNGWEKWKDIDSGKSLDEIIRKVAPNQ